MFALDAEGREVWRIAARQHVYADSPYTAIKVGEGQLTAFNWDGVEVTVDTTSWVEVGTTYGR